MNEIAINNIKTEAGGVLNDASSLQITTNDEFEFAQHFLLGIKALVNKINDTLGPDIKKAHDLHKSMLTTKNTLLEPVQKAESLVKGKVGRYQRMLEDQRRKEAEELIEKNIIPFPVEKTQVKGISFNDQWKFEIMDESLVPREFLIPDLPKLGRVVRAMKDKTNIPGVRVYSEQGVRATT